MAVSSKSKRRARAGQRTLKGWEFRPHLEALEGRLAPAAGVFTVTTLADDGSAGSLRGAVNQADKFIGAAQVVFAVNGVFKLTQFNTPGAPSPNTGDINITNNISFIGNGQQQTIVDANGIDRAFWISGPLTVNFNDLTIRNGIAGANSTGLTAAATGSEGGAVYAATAGATLNFTNVTITGNRALSNGGAIAAESAAMNINNAYIASNIATVSGGAISVDTGAAVTITNSHLELNNASGSGGAIFIGTNVGTQPTLTITGSLLNNNRAEADGGAIDDSSTTGGGVTLFNTTLINNFAFTDGGAIWTSGDVNIDGNGGAPLGIGGRNNIGFNTALTSGGAIYQSKLASPTAPTMSIANTNLSANHADNIGGAIYTTGSSVSLTNVLMVLNSAGSYGGAVADSATTADSLTITASVLNNNTAQLSGGAVYSFSPNVSVTGSRFDFNVSTAGSGGAIYDNGATNFSLAQSFLTDNRAHLNGGGVASYSTTATFTGDQIVGNVTTDEGGGIEADGTVLNISESQVIGNTTANSHGGGISSSSATVNLINDIVNANVATFAGGGMYFNGGGTVTIVNSTVRNNTSQDSGGGVWFSGTSLAITGSNVTNNTAISSGGGVYATAATLSLTSNLISGNSSQLSGGGVYFTGGGTLLANADTFSLNTATQDGGGLWTDATAVTFTAPGLGSLFSGNRAGRNGGGVFRNFDGTTADVGAKFINVTFAANSAASKGGAIFNQYAGTKAAGTAKLTLMNDTLNLNAAAAGSAIFANNTGPGGSAVPVTIDNTIIAGAPPGAGPNLGSAGAGVSYASLSPGSNLTDNPADLVVNGGKLSGFAANNVGLGALQDNGGPTFTFPLLPGSPAIDAATADQNPADGVPNADQRGVPRPLPVPGGTVDIGAVEANLPDQFIVAAPAPGNAGGVAINVYQAVPTNAGPPPLVGTVNASDFTGGVHVALADVNGDGVPDLIVGSGPHEAPLVEVFSLNKNNGTFGTRIGSKIVPFDTAFQGGVYVAGGQFNGDRHADVVVGAGQGGGPEVKVYTLYKTGTDALLGTPVPIPLPGTGADGGFLAFPGSFGGGVSVAVADTNGDGQDDIVTAQASGGGLLNVFDGSNLTRQFISNLQPFGSGFTGGLNVAGENYGRTVGGSVLQDIYGDIVVGQASTGGSVKIFDGDTHAQVGNAINPFGSTFTGGVSVAGVKDINGNGNAEIIVGQTSGQGQIHVIDESTLAFLDTFFANTAFTNGVFVGGGF